MKTLLNILKRIPCYVLGHSFWAKYYKPSQDIYSWIKVVKEWSKKEVENYLNQEIK